MYAKMPFGLINVGATFQRELVIAFVGEKDKFVVIYLDEITVFSKIDEEHIEHLQLTFEKCRKYALSVNPKKSQFSLSGGNLLGHIVEKQGVKIDPKRVEDVNKISLPGIKKEVHVCFSKINFLRRFIPNYSQTVKEITEMFKKENEVKWNLEPRESFCRIKRPFAEVPLLVIPDYLKSFFSFFFFFSSSNGCCLILEKQ